MNTFGMMMDKYVEEMEARIAKLENIALESESGSGNSVQLAVAGSFPHRHAAAY